jgi:DNA-binding NtrC family response regulator
MTGVSQADARGQVCRRRRDPRPESLEVLQHALAPPQEALAGKPTRVRRLVPGGLAGPRWWDVSYFPLAAADGLLGILGRITAVAPEGTPRAPLLPERLVALRERLRQGYSLEYVDNDVPAMRRVAEQMRLAAQTQAPVLLRGEPGSGKEWIARTIHQASPGRERSFAALDCSRLPEAALEAVLFGPAGLLRAGIGTLYLKEPQRLPRELQARVLDLLATTSTLPGLHVLAGCGSDPGEEVRTGKLLPDLHFALSTLTISLPPLRERLAELPILVERMLEQLRPEDDRVAKGLSAEAFDALRGHPWPGNLDELHTVLAEACIRAKGNQITVEQLPWYVRNLELPPEQPLLLDKLLEQVERRLILLALRKAHNNKTRAAEILGIWRPRLLRRMEALGIEEERGERRGTRDEGSEGAEQEPGAGSDLSKA